MSISYLAYFGVFTPLVLSKALVLVSRPCNVLSIAMEAESGPRVWWTEAQPLFSRFPVTGEDDYGHIGTHFGGRGRPQRRGTYAGSVGGLQPYQRGCRDP